MPRRARDVSADRLDVADTIAALLLAVDERDWTRILALLDDTVRTDYRSLFGGEVVTQSAAELVGAWRGLLPGFDATQHLLGPIPTTVDGDHASARCAVTATHRLGDADWTVAGAYDFELVRAGRWRVRAITLHTRYVSGDTTIPERATARASQV